MYRYLKKKQIDIFLLENDGCVFLEAFIFMNKVYWQSVTEWNLWSIEQTQLSAARNNVDVHVTG